jgi:hypothetical protein
MKRLALALAVTLLCPALLTGPVAAKPFYNPLSHCGTERWHIKTLDDSQATLINGTPIASTIAQMRALAVPSGFNKNNDASRYTPVEETEYTIQAKLVGFKEEGDRDFHVVLADPSNATVTMIGEIPDPKCSTVIAGGHATKIAKVRNSFVKCFGPAPANGKYKKFTGTMIAELTGVGFFDYIHPIPQTGVAPNAIELHPILRVKTISGTCPTGYSVP